MLAFDHRIKMLKEGAVKRHLTQVEMRRCLYDVYAYLNAYNREEFPQSDWWRNFESTAKNRITEFANTYLLTDKPEYVIEGNLKMIDEIAWWVNAQIMPKVTWEGGEAGAMWAGIAIKIVASLVAVVAPLLGPAITGIALTAAAVLQVIASAIAKGDLTLDQIQTLGGTSVAFALNQATIRLDGMKEELDKINQIAEALK